MPRLPASAPSRKAGASHAQQTRRAIRKQLERGPATLDSLHAELDHLASRNQILSACRTLVSAQLVNNIDGTYELWDHLAARLKAAAGPGRAFRDDDEPPMTGALVA